MTPEKDNVSYVSLPICSFKLNFGKWQFHFVLSDYPTQSINNFLKLVFVTSSRLCHFSIVCSVPWPLNRSEAGGHPVLLQPFYTLMIIVTGLFA